MLERDPEPLASIQPVVPPGLIGSSGSASRQGSHSRKMLTSLAMSWAEELNRFGRRGRTPATRAGLNWVAAP